MDPWVIWLLAAVVFAIGEIATTSFFLAPFSIGAFSAAAVSLIGGGATASWVVFAVVTTVVFLGVRPVARRHLRQPAQVRTGAAALVGRPAIVAERIANDEGTGIIKLDGEIWTARAWDESRIFDAGDKVEVVEIRGATAMVDGRYEH
jgi:membrane protein implicated in regulation of membrane protease activity